MEHKELKTNLKRDLTPYEISKYLKEVYQIDMAPQRIYRDRKDGRLASYSKKVGNRSKWFVKKEDATVYILRVLNGSTKIDKAW